jgi:hypothetical protein
VLVRCIMWLCGKGHLRSRESKVATFIKYLCLRRMFCCTAENDNYIVYGCSCHIWYLSEHIKNIIKLHTTMNQNIVLKMWKFFG